MCRRATRRRWSCAARTDAAAGGPPAPVARRSPGVGWRARRRDGAGRPYVRRCRRLPTVARRVRRVALRARLSLGLPPSVNHQPCFVLGPPMVAAPPGTARTVGGADAPATTTERGSRNVSDRGRAPARSSTTCPSERSPSTGRSVRCHRYPRSRRRRRRPCRGTTRTPAHGRARSSFGAIRTATSMTGRGASPPPPGCRTRTTTPSSTSGSRPTATRGSVRTTLPWP